MTRPLAIGIAALTLFVGARLSRAASYFFTAAVEQHNTISGQQTYDFELSVSRFQTSAGDFTLEVVAPDGTRYGETNPVNDRLNTSILGLAPSEVNARLAGEWTFEERTSPTVLNRYRFIIPTIVPSAHFVTPPLITSPSDGAVVGRVFDVAWTPGSIGNGFSIRSTRTPGAGGPNIERQFDGLVTFTYAAQGFTPFQIVQLEIDHQILAPGGLQITKLNSGADSSFTDILAFETYSPPIALTVVPEPQTCTLLSLGAAVGIGRRRRKAS